MDQTVPEFSSSHATWPPGGRLRGWELGLRPGQARSPGQVLLKDIAVLRLILILARSPVSVVELAQQWDSESRRSSPPSNPNMRDQQFKCCMFAPTSAAV